jgi:4-hydroxybenzoate polyprenyltransferase
MPVQLAYIAFVFFATLLMYSVHRIVGLDKMESFKDKGRYSVIFVYKQHIIIYAFLAGIACIFFYLNFESRIQVLLIGAILLSIAYVLPMFGEKRLRDLNNIKIFIIALSWAYVVVSIPLEYMGINGFETHTFLFIEKAAFIFGLTIPFDIRDLEYDRFSQVETLPQKMGIEKSIYLAIGFIILALGMAVFLYLIDIYSLAIFFGIILVYIITIALIWNSKSKSSDYYYSGILDGMIILYSMVLIIIQYWF